MDFSVMKIYFEYEIIFYFYFGRFCRIFKKIVDIFFYVILYFYEEEIKVKNC